MIYSRIPKFISSRCRDCQEPIPPGGVVAAAIQAAEKKRSREVDAPPPDSEPPLKQSPQPREAPEPKPSQLPPPQRQLKRRHGTDFLDRVPPWSEQMEQGILCSVFLKNDVIEEVIGIINDAHFYAEPHRVMFRLMCDMWGRREPIEPLTIAHELKTAGKFEQIGGDEYLLTIAGAEATSMNAGHYARVVRDLAIRRDAAAEFNRLAVAAYDGVALPVIFTESQWLLDRFKHSASQLDGLGSVFSDAPTVPEFLKAEDDSSDESLAGGIVVKAGITQWSSPRGFGKTLLALYFAIAFGRLGLRVLYVTFENSPKMLRERLRRFGGSESNNLKILTRSKAPKLTTDAWSAFPVEDFDLVFIDSISPALEGGVDEGSGGQNSDVVAALLDIVQRGPGIVILANTTKDGRAVRGSGIFSDRADLAFEIRDATDLKADPKAETWWETLTEDQGESGWAARARRRHGKTVFRLAVVPSKVRIGPELEPLALEISLPVEGLWTVADVTADVVRAHEQAKVAIVEANAEREAKAIAELKLKLPLAKLDAEAFLAKQKIPRKAARSIIADRTNLDWAITGAGTRKSPFVLTLVEAADLAIAADAQE